MSLEFSQLWDIKGRLCSVCSASPIFRHCRLSCLDKSSQVFRCFWSNECCNVPHVSHAVVTAVITCVCRRQPSISSESRITQSDIPLHYANSVFLFIYRGPRCSFICLIIKFRNVMRPLLSSSLPIVIFSPITGHHEVYY